MNKHNRRTSRKYQPVRDIRATIIKVAKRKAGMKQRAYNTALVKAACS